MSGPFGRFCDLILMEKTKLKDTTLEMNVYYTMKWV